MSKLCGAHLPNGSTCTNRIKDEAIGCYLHPQGRATQVISHDSADKAYSKASGIYSEITAKESHRIPGKYDVEPEDILLPGDSMRQYYSDIEKKHFGDIDVPGSVFTEAEDLMDLLEMAQEQKDMGLSDDDRDWYLKQGVNPEALREGIRYIRVESPGVLGSGDSTHLKDDDIVVPIQKSTSRGGNEFRLSFPVDEKPTVDYGTVDYNVIL